MDGMHNVRYGITIVNAMIVQYKQILQDTEHIGDRDLKMKITT